MFFETNVFSVNSIAVFKLNWGNRYENSDIRPYHALSYRIKGDAKFISAKEIVKARTGDIIFVPAYHPYTLSSGEEQIYVIHFTANKKLPEKIKNFSPESTVFYEKCFCDIYNAYSKKQKGYEHECQYVFHKLAMRIERDYENSKSNRSNRLSQAIEHIHENFSNPQLTVSQLALECGMSETYFRKLFYKNYKMTPLEYINNLKLKYAVELLKSRYYTVSEVANKCGFDNPYYFSTFIKNKTGCPPSDFIKNNELII